MKKEVTVCDGCGRPIDVVFKADMKQRVEFQVDRIAEVTMLVQVTDTRMSFWNDRPDLCVDCIDAIKTALIEKLSGMEE